MIPGGGDLGAVTFRPGGDLLIGTTAMGKERIVSQVAELVKEACDTDDVGVVAVGQHLCTMMRGARSDCDMTSSALLGSFRIPEVRAEFLALAKTKE